MKNMRRHRQVGLVIALAVVIAIVAGIATRTTHAAATAARDHVTLNLWAYEGYQDYLPVLKKEFEKAHPNITLEITNIPEDQYTTKLQTAFVAGDPPDLAFIYDRKFLKAGEFAPVDSIVAPNHIKLKGYNPGILGGKGKLNAEDACSYGNHIYCLGSYTGVVMMFYNRSMFRAAHIPYPSTSHAMTVKQFADISCKLTKANVGAKWGSAQGDPITWGPWELVVSKDGRKVIANKTVFPQVESTVAGMIRNHCSPSLSVLDPWAQGGDYFAQKKIAMVITDFQSLFKIDKAHIDWGVTMPPAPAGYKSFFNVWTDNIGVTAASKHQAEAKELVAFQTTVGQKLRVKVTGDLPASTYVAKQLHWAGHSVGRNEALQILPHARPNISIPDRWDVVGPFFDAFGYIVDGKDPQKTIDSAVPKVQQALDKAWKQWEQTKSK
jgi:multiple sugar transport system substrate-binding protein